LYKVLVDIRGSEIKKIKKILPLMEMPYEIKHTVSDFVLFRDDEAIAVFERKTVQDFVSSLGKRLNGQTLTMLPYNPASYIVLVGELSDIKYVAKMRKQAFSEEHFFGAIASISVRTGINILWVKNNVEAVVLIDKICKKIAEEKMNIPHTAKKDKDKLRVISLCFCWGVRPAMAKKLLKKFGSIENILKASQKELGVSKRIYNSIQEFYRK